MEGKVVTFEETGATVTLAASGQVMRHTFGTKPPTVTIPNAACLESVTQRQYNTVWRKGRRVLVFRNAPEFRYGGELLRAEECVLEEYNAPVIGVVTRSAGRG